MIYDLHNDFITSENFSNIFLPTNNKIIYAIWTSLLKEENIRKILYNLPDGQLYSIEDIGNITDYDIFKIKKLQYCSLTWNNNNIYAGGALDDGNLTDQGKEIIKFFNSNKLTVDLAHLNRKSFYSVIDSADKVICSHTCFNGYYNHLRNLSDNQIKCIIQKGGIIGVCFVSNFMTNNKYGVLNDIIHCIDYFCQKFSCDHLAIGSDFFGSKNLIKNIKNYNDIAILQDKLLKIGYNIIDIDKIFYSNANNFFKE